MDLEMRPVTVSASGPHGWPWVHSRPLLGANGTEAMSALLGQGDAALVDYLKVGPFMGEAAIAALAPCHPLLLHLEDTLSRRGAPSEALIQRNRRLIRLTGPPWISTHISYGAADANLRNALHTCAVSDLLSREEAFDNIVRNACALAEGLGAPLILENIPCFPNPAHAHVCEPAFIAAVLEETGCGLLLDLAHARVSADVLGYEVHDYLLALPLARAVELHLSGPRAVYEAHPRLQSLARENLSATFGERNLVDAHEPMREEDYALLAWTLERTRPKALSLEYYRDPLVLREQLLRLGGIIGR